MIFEQIDAGGDRNFSYLIGDEESRLCAVVDPGYDTSKLEARVKDLGLKVAYILNTHTHHDHVAGNDVFHKGDVKLAAYKEARRQPGHQAGPWRCHSARQAAYRDPVHAGALSGLHVCAGQRQADDR